MARLYRAEGYTLLEMLLVLLVCTILVTGVLPRPASHLSSVMTAIENRCLQAQLAAMAARKKTEVTIDPDGMEAGGSRYVFPAGVACAPASFHYTPDGTISTGLTLTCTEGNRTASLVFRIGAGRIRAES